MSDSTMHGHLTGGPDDLSSNDCIQTCYRISKTSQKLVSYNCNPVVFISFVQK